MITTAEGSNEPLAVIAGLDNWQISCSALKTVILRLAKESLNLLSIPHSPITTSHLNA